MKKGALALYTTVLLGAGCSVGVSPIEAAVSTDLSTGREDLGEGSADLTSANPRDAMEAADLSPGITTLQVPLTKAMEPAGVACNAAGAKATGSATVTIDAAGSMITVSDLTYRGLSSAVTMIHIHGGPLAGFGPILLDFGGNLTSPVNRTFTAADYRSPPVGGPANFPAVVAAVKAGQTYFNVHTTSCSGGELRGQLM